MFHNTLAAHLKRNIFILYSHCAQNKGWAVKNADIHAIESSSQMLVNKLSSVWVSIITGTLWTRGRPVWRKWLAMLGHAVTPVLCYSGRGTPMGVACNGRARPWYWWLCFLIYLLLPFVHSIEGDPTIVCNTRWYAC